MRRAPSTTLVLALTVASGLLAVPAPVAAVSTTGPPATGATGSARASGVAAGPRAAAAPRPTGATGSGRAAAAPAGRADFNGDGYGDLAVGVPGEDVGRAADAGAVVVLAGSPSGISGGRLIEQDNPETGDWFGAALAAGDFNGDGYGDLAVGAPWENVGAVLDAGAVTVLYGSPIGLDRTQTLLQNDPERGDRFGAALASGADALVGAAVVQGLVVGAPGERVGTQSGAGAVSAFFPSPDGLLPGPLLLEANPEAGDRFGAALAAGNASADPWRDLAVGAPGEDVGSAADAGAVTVLTVTGDRLGGRSGQLLLQSNPERGDRFGTAVQVSPLRAAAPDGVAVGAPGEGVGAAAAAGAVTAFFFTPAGAAAGSQTIVQSNPEAGDRFGAALQVGSLNRLDPGAVGDLLVGAPGEDLGGTHDAGAVSIFPVQSSGPSASASQTLTQGGAAEPGDGFGASIQVSSLTGDALRDLVVGVPGENVGGVFNAGAVTLFAGTSGGVAAGGAALFQGGAPVSGDSEDGDAFGATLGAGRQPGGGGR